MVTDLKNHAKNVINLAPKLLLMNATLFLASLWFASCSISIIYHIGTVLLALVFIGLTIVCWKTEPDYLSAINFIIPVIGMGKLIEKAQNACNGDWWTVFIELFALFGVIMFSVLFVFNSKIKHYIGIASDLNSDVMPDRTN